MFGCAAWCWVVSGALDGTFNLTEHATDRRALRDFVAWTDVRDAEGLERSGCCVQGACLALPGGLVRGCLTLAGRKLAENLLLFVNRISARSHSQL